MLKTPKFFSFLLLFFYASLTFAKEPFAKNLSLDLTKVSVSEALRYFAKKAGRDLILSPEVKGSMTLHLHQISAEQAFQFVLKAQALKAWHQGRFWYVAPAEVLIKQRQEETRWLEASEASARLSTEVWQIRYAKATELAEWLQEGKSWLSKRGLIHIDARTNSLCVEDTEERLAALRQVFKRLDIPLKQILIEARLAAVDSDYEKVLGFQWSQQESGAGESTSKGSFTLTVLPSPENTLLDIKLRALEEEGHGEVISSPSLLTASQQSASIESGEELPYQQKTKSGITLVFKRAVLSLKVTPQILPGGKILLQLQLIQDYPNNRLFLGAPAISTRQLITSVLVPQGQTVVLGGIYEANREKNVDGLPFLRRLPVIAWLFEARAERKTKRELLIFVSPKIIE